ncbi:MAG: UDP-glucose/GDP-mannose dehydrogenase family protein [Desulfobacteraceae bacterium]|nr:MAG: UDP-glucose/GDP-mannose dehydrogenase family protein [Desulfobacteraceae bacterium]
MIGIIGLGFVGLTTGVGLALQGHQVMGYDIDAFKLRQIQEGKIPFYEKGLPEALAKVLYKQFIPVAQWEALLKECDVLFLCVGTPSTSAGADLSAIYAVLEKIIASRRRDIVLAIKSTVPPGTSKEIIQWLREKGIKVGADIGLANNPEFLREGTALNDFMNPDRIVIGASDQKSGDRVHVLYESFRVPVWRVSLTTAEFIKYLSNTFLATLISFANEMANIGEVLGDIDVQSAFKALHQDRRWQGKPAPMTSYVWPGCGFGGYCLPKDTIAMIRKAEAIGIDPELLRSVYSVNLKRKTYLVDLLEKKLGSLEGKTVAVLGLAFKPETDDIRDTPAAGIIQELVERKAKVVAYDPLAGKNFKNAISLKIDYADSLDQAVRSADAVFIATAWEEFKKRCDCYAGKVVLDGRYYL